MCSNISRDVLVKNDAFFATPSIVSSVFNHCRWWRLDMPHRHLVNLIHLPNNGTSFYRNDRTHIVGISQRIERNWVIFLLGKRYFFLAPHTDSFLTKNLQHLLRVFYQSRQKNNIQHEIFLLLYFCLYETIPLYTTRSIVADDLYFVFNWNWLYKTSFQPLRIFLISLLYKKRIITRWNKIIQHLLFPQRELLLFI